ncbi:terminase large subunit domain-containing protein [Alkalicoccobacillus murimartini]|uniref:Terminase large subunit-like ATPase domain-containing protein n=1 Tax=Alkalicoccobacillus murimartini TaxID=171685 RepID=A0ABT9YLY9_9BACI|nr:terminase large subunit [Alkalicoccobacillus murimartini]MDQ0208880.1 hypothetical protein [Alkalicoccobacillus murimartini]
MSRQRHYDQYKRDKESSKFYKSKAWRSCRGLVLNIGFIEKFCKPSQGDYDSIVMQDWQHFAIGSMYGWVHMKTKYRRFKEGLILVARKNGKSGMGSGLSIYGTSKDGEKGARVYQLANSKAQAKVLFNECKAMVESSPVLNKHFERTLSEIRYNDTLSKIEAPKRGTMGSICISTGIPISLTAQETITALTASAITKDAPGRLITASSTITIRLVSLRRTDL